MSAFNRGPNPTDNSKQFDVLGVKGLDNLGIIQDVKTFMLEHVFRMPYEEWEDNNSFDYPTNLVRPVGSGHFTVAYEMEQYPDIILKVSIRDSDAGPVYWKYCLDHAGEVLIPDTYAVGQAVVRLKSQESYQESQVVQWCIVKRLDNLRDLFTEDWDAKPHPAHALFHYLTGDEGSIPWVPNAGRPEGWLDRHCPDANQRWGAEYQQYRIICECMARLGQVDVHADNMMVDPQTGKLYLTDVISFRKGTENEEAHAKLEPLDLRAGVSSPGPIGGAVNLGRHPSHKVPGVLGAAGRGVRRILSHLRGRRVPVGEHPVYMRAIDPGRDHNRLSLLRRALFDGGPRDIFTVHGVPVIPWGAGGVQDMEPGQVPRRGGVQQGGR